MGDIETRLIDLVGGIDRFSGNWNWRSHYPKQRAESAIRSAVEDIADGVKRLSEDGATAEQVEEWTSKAIGLWLAFQSAGARTANPMVTGPANFPVARNQKAMASERKRGEEYYIFVHQPTQWLSRRKQLGERAALSAASSATAHRALTFPGVTLVQNATLDRVQLLFEGKPAAETISSLKGEAFRWSPREQAWQRKNTNNGVQAAYRILRSLGHERGDLVEQWTDPRSSQ